MFTKLIVTLAVLGQSGLIYCIETDLLVYRILFTKEYPWKGFITLKGLLIRGKLWSWHLEHWRSTTLGSFNPQWSTLRFTSRCMRCAFEYDNFLVELQCLEVLDIFTRAKGEYCKFNVIFVIFEHYVVLLKNDYNCRSAQISKNCIICFVCVSTQCGQLKVYQPDRQNDWFAL